MKEKKLGLWNMEVNRTALMSGDPDFWGGGIPG
jgi:hypothetical protein